MKKRLLNISFTLFSLIGIIFCILFLLDQHTCGWVVPTQQPYPITLRVAADRDFEPLVFANEAGEPAGHDVELLYILAEKLGFQVEIDLMSWEEAQKSMRLGTHDILLGAPYSEKRKTWLEFSTPTLTESYKVFGFEQHRTGLTSLYHTRVAIMKGDNIEEAFLNTEALNATVFYFDNYRDCFNALCAKECDYVVATQSGGLSTIQNLGLNGIKISDMTIYNSIFGLAVSKGNLKLLNRINQALFELNQDGTLEKIYHHWMIEHTRLNSPLTLIKLHPYLFTLITLGASFAFLAVVYFYERRRSKFEKKADTLLRRERMQYRDALLHNCHQAYTFDVEEGIIHEMLKTDLNNMYPIVLPLAYDATIRQLIKQANAVLLHGTLEENTTAGYLAAYAQGHRLLELEYYLPKRNVYQRKSTFLSKDEETGHILACVIIHDITGMRKKELEIKRALIQLAETAEQIAQGNLEATFPCDMDGDIGLVSNIFQQTVNELKDQMDTIAALAYQDALTGVANKTAYDKSVQELELGLSQKAVISFGVVMFDLNNLKLVNDTLGHEIGDLYIQTAIHQIQEVFWGIVLYRIGGDEFVALIDSSRLYHLSELVDTLQNRVAVYNETQTQFPTGISFAVGYTTYDAEQDTCYADVYRRADALMYENKRIQKGLLNKIAL